MASHRKNAALKLWVSSNASLTGRMAVEVIVDLTYLAIVLERSGQQKASCGRIVDYAIRCFTRRLGCLAVSGRQVSPAADTNGEAPGQPLVACQTVWCVTSTPRNFHPDDDQLVKKHLRFLADLRRTHGFSVQEIPQDYHGYHVCRADRLRSHNVRERAWGCKEKGVDVALAMRLCERSRALDRPGGIILIAGDADYAPALDEALRCDPSIHVAVAGFSHSVSRIYDVGNFAGYSWQHSPILLDGFLQESGKGTTGVIVRNHTHRADTDRSKETTKMKNLHQSNHGGPSRLEAGRVEVVAPAYGCLEVYLKRDGASHGASFVSEEDGGKFGVIFRVLERFGGPGHYWGWGYVDEERTRVFRFVLQGVDNRPADLVAINNRNGRVDLPPFLRDSNKAFKGGTLVAFHARPVSHERGQQKRTATKVFPVDAERFPVVVRLVGTGELFFPDHNEVLDILFEGLSNSLDRTVTNRSLLALALDRVANDANIPAQYQTLARVERSKGFGSGTRPGPTTPVRQQSGPALGQGAHGRGSDTSKAEGDHVVTDIVHLDLHLGEE